MGETVTLDIKYDAEPTLARFHASDASIRGIMGPIGSGKSVGCCIEIIAWAHAQEPNKNGVRRTRFAIVRNTYPELKSTTIKTWQEWMPPEVAPIVYDSPIYCHYVSPVLEDGTTVDMEVYFVSLDKPKDLRKVLSLELTGAWLNEARELSFATVMAVDGRLGRFPPEKDGVKPTRVGLIMDTNPPDDDHWWYQKFELEKPDGWSFFRQPSALIRVEGKDGPEYYPNPDCENVSHQPLGYSYWLRLIPGRSEDWIKVYVLGEYGTVQDGKPVYPEYRDGIHCAKTDLQPYKGIPLILGWDFGLTPACIIGQITPKGQLRILREIVAVDMGIQQFTRDVVKPILTTEYSGLAVQSVGDPAGTQRAQTEETTCLQILELEGIPTDSALTNEYIARREAVVYYMTRMIDGEPGFQLSPRCKILRKGFNGAYKLERIQVSSDERYRDRPLKNRFSHPHDALQYLCLKALGGFQVQSAAQRRRVTTSRSNGWAA